MGTDSGGIGRAGRRQKRRTSHSDWNALTDPWGKGAAVRSRLLAAGLANVPGFAEKNRYRAKAEGRARVRPKVIKIKVGHQRTSADEDPSRRALDKNK